MIACIYTTENLVDSSFGVIYPSVDFGQDSKL